MNEKQIQVAAFDWLYRKGYKLIVPNIYLWKWDSDILAINKNNFLYEFEIKISRSDFKADFKKIEKHENLKNGIGPSRFYYITTFALNNNDVPKYAGLIYYNKDFKVIKRAPKINRYFVNKKQINKMHSSIYYRFWEKIRKEIK